MRIVLFANNWVGWQVAEWLRRKEESIVGLVLHPATKQQYGAELRRAAGVPDTCVFDASQLAQAAVIERIASLQPELGLSLCFGYILRRPVLSLFSRDVVNLHTSLLPYNRGAYPNVWSIVDRTPAGVSLHYIDEGVDTGDIIAQIRVPVEPIDTGETLYRKLERVALVLFQGTWEAIKSGQAPRLSQLRTEGSEHRLRDVNKIDYIDLDKTYTAGALIDIIRARTFASHRGAYFVHEGRKVHLSLELKYEDDIEWRSTSTPDRPERETQ